MLRLRDMAIEVTRILARPETPDFTLRHRRPDSPISSRKPERFFRFRRVCVQVVKRFTCDRARDVAGARDVPARGPPSRAVKGAAMSIVTGKVVEGIEALGRGYNLMAQGASVFTLAPA